MVNWFTAELALVLAMASAAGAAPIPSNLQVFAGDAHIYDQILDCDGIDSTSGDTPIPYDPRLFSLREVYDPEITEPSSSTIWSIGQRVTVSWCVMPLRTRIYGLTGNLLGRRTTLQKISRMM